jgi:hypothetical protein
MLYAPAIAAQSLKKVSDLRAVENSALSKRTQYPWHHSVDKKNKSLVCKS